MTNTLREVIRAFIDGQLSSIDMLELYCDEKLAEYGVCGYEWSSAVFGRQMETLVISTPSHTDEMSFRKASIRRMGICASATHPSCNTSKSGLDACGASIFKDIQEVTPELFELSSNERKNFLIGLGAYLYVKANEI